MADKIAKYSSMIEPITNLDIALEQVENVYNYKNRKRVYIKTNYLKSRDSGLLLRNMRERETKRKQAQRNIQ